MNTKEWIEHHAQQSGEPEKYKEAQEEMYELTETYHELQEIEMALRKAISRVMEKRRKLGIEWPTIDIYKRKE